GRRGVGPKVPFVRPDHGHDPVLEVVSGGGHVVRPLVLLDRPVRRCAALTVLGVVVLEADPGRDDFLHAVSPTQQSESSAIGEEPGRFPANEHIVAVVADVDFHSASYVSRQSYSRSVSTMRRSWP